MAASVDARLPTVMPFPLEADGCTDVVVVPGDEVSSIDLEASDSEGHLLARSKDGGRVRTMTVCSPVAMGAFLSIRPHLGRGLAAVVVGRARGEAVRDLATRADVAWAATVASVAAAREARNAELSKAGYEGPKSSVLGNLVLGKRTSVPVDLRGVGEPCARIDVVAGAPLTLLEGALWNDDGGLLASSQGVASATLFACGVERGRLDLETKGRPGPFAVLVRRERWRALELAGHPLASARMLARSAEGTSVVQEGAAGEVRVLGVGAEKVESWAVTVPAGRCVSVAAGGQGAGAGLELRLLDGLDGPDGPQELDRSYGANAARVLACAPSERQRALRVEVRVFAGKLDVVVGQRTRDG